MRPGLPLASLLLAFALIGCQSSSKQEAAKPEARPPIPVRVAPVSRGTVDACLQTTGTLKAVRESKVGPKVGGVVERILVEEGASVQEGEPLVVLEGSSFRLAREEAAAALALAEAQLRQILTGNRQEVIEQARGRLQEAQAHLANAELELRRVEKLFETGTVPKKLYDQTVTQHKAAEALFRVAQEGYNMALRGATQEEVQVARAQVDRARASLRRAEQTLADATIYAPFSGVVIKRLANVGEYVSTMGQTPLLFLMAMDPLELELQIPEVNRQDVAPGNLVEIRPDALPGEQFQGKVTEIIPAVDPLSRTFRTVVRIPNRDNRLTPGMFCRVRLSVCKGKEVLRIPRSAVFQEAGQSTVLLLLGDLVRKRAVTLGGSDERHVEVLSGLQEGDLVVVDTEAGIPLEEGTRVEVLPHGPGTPAGQEKESH